MKLKSKIIISAMVACGLVFTMPSMAADRFIAGHVPSAVSRLHLRPLQHLSDTNRLSLAIGLPLRNPEALTNLLHRLYDPASPDYRHFLTSEQFAEQFGPREEDYQAVMAFARQSGFEVTGTYSNHALIDVRGSVADIERALHVKLNLYQHPSEQRLFYAPDVEPSISSGLPILHIAGLNDFIKPHPMYHTTPLTQTNATPAAFTGSGPRGTFMGQDFRTAYAPGVALTGSGQTVALVQFDSGFNQSDITIYESLTGLPNVPVAAVLIDGYNGAPGDGNIEVSLDIEMAISMAPGLSQVLVYEGSSADDILAAIATTNTAKQISASWSYGTDATTEELFQEFAAQGQSFFNASGDYDSWSGYSGSGSLPLGTILTPCDDPNITIVGGTSLTTTPPGGARISETVWNTGYGYGSGGGTSMVVTIPSWQQGINMSTNLGSTTMRNIPDVAFTADNVLDVFSNGLATVASGTSCAAPLWAGFTALVNEQALANNQPTVGFLNPTLYTIGKGIFYASAFNDITTGSNTNETSLNLFFAVPGYDLCTGWGTPAGVGMINALLTVNLNFTNSFCGVAVDAAGDLFVADNRNSRIRKVATNGIITTVAGNGIAAYGGDNGTATNANLNFPDGVAVDAAGNLFIADHGNNRIRKVGTSGIITTVAGNGVAGYAGDGGAATNASLNGPGGIAVDSAGNLYFADSGNSRIRKVAGGIITTVAGNGSMGYFGDGLAATNAELFYPCGVAIDSVNNLFIADKYNFRVRKVAPSGVISTVAGNGIAGYSGDGGMSTNASLWQPCDVAVDVWGNLYIADSVNARVRKVAPGGVITTLAGNGSAGYGGDGGIPTSANLNGPVGVTADSSGHLFIADYNNARVREILMEDLPALTLNNVTTNQAGSYSVIISNAAGSITSSNASLTVLVPPVITTEPTNVTVTLGSNAVFSVTATGTPPLTYQWQFDGTNLPNNIITTVAGNGSPGYSGDGGVATNGALDLPRDVAVDTAGNLFIADYLNCVIRMVTTNGILLTVAGNGTNGYTGDGGMATNASLSHPWNVAVDALDNLYIADGNNNCIRKVAANGIITTVAGNGTRGYSGDGGVATNATLAAPRGVAVDGMGNLFIGDTGNDVVREVTTNGIILTMAGNGTNGYSGDGGLATNATLRNPFGVAVDTMGNLFIADIDNNVVRKVNTSGIITTFAGNGTNGYTGDSGAATNACLNLPWNVAMDAGGNLFIADYQNQVIRKVNASGIISTVAGNGMMGYSGNGGAATNASLENPSGVAVDHLGNLFIADTYNAVIREVDFGFGLQSTLTLNNVTTNQAGSYSVIISNAAGSITSSNAVLTCH